MKSFSVTFPFREGNPHAPSPSAASVSRRMGRLWIETCLSSVKTFFQSALSQSLSILPFSVKCSAPAARDSATPLIIPCRRNSSAASSSGFGRNTCRSAHEELVERQLCQMNRHAAFRLHSSGKNTAHAPPRPTLPYMLSLSHGMVLTNLLYSISNIYRHSPVM